MKYFAIVNCDSHLQYNTLLFGTMSWSKFNESFNSLKGQVTTFIQENIVPEDEEDAHETPAAKVDYEEMSGLIAAQENEVLTYAT